jgi:hypothetical protein
MDRIVLHHDPWLLRISTWKKWEKVEGEGVDTGNASYEMHSIFLVSKY